MGSRCLDLSRFADNQIAGSHVEQQRHEQQDQGDLHQGGAVEIAGGGEFVYEQAAHGLRGSEGGEVNSVAVADDHGDGDGFAGGAGEAEDDGAEEGGAGVSQHFLAGLRPARQRLAPERAGRRRARRG